MIDALDYIRGLGPKAPIYTNVCSDGTNFNIAIELMRRHSVSGEQFTLTPLRVAALHYIENNIASIQRVAELAKRPQDSLGPILLCEAAPGYTWEFELPELQTSAALADGHHRYCLASFRRQPLISVVLYRYSTWRNFVVDGLRDLSRNELLADPITKRSY